MSERPNGPESASSQSPQSMARQMAQKKQAMASQAQPKTAPGSAPNQQQLQALKEQQMRQVRAKMGKIHFAHTTQEILRKFSKYPPSLTFHIYKTHYRFNNTPDSSMIPKESPMAKSFMKHVIREEIPVEMAELLKDCAVRFYDGCLILQVYDHRDMVPVQPPAGSAAVSAGAPNGSVASISDGSKPKNGDKTDEKTAQSTPKQANSQVSAPASTASSRPKTYRTLLRPTPLSLYYDMLYHTDSTVTRFNDLIALQMEAEILTLTNRKLDLHVPLNPYLQEGLLRPETEAPKVVYDEKDQDYRVVHSHREASEVEVRKLHSEQTTMQKSSEFEELMFLLSGRHKHAVESTSEKKLVVVGPSAAAQAAENGSLEHTPSAASNASGLGADKKTASLGTGGSGLAGGSATSSQFMRLRFVEEIRKRRESQKAQAGAAVAAHTQTTMSGPSLGPVPAANVGANGNANGVFRKQVQVQPEVAQKAPFPSATNMQQGPMRTAGQGAPNQFQQNQSFQKQQQQQQQQQISQNTSHQRQVSGYAQQPGTTPQQGYTALQSQVSSSQGGQTPMAQTPQGMTPRMGQDYTASPLTQNARPAPGVARHNPLMQNNQPLSSMPSPQQQHQQQQQLAKQAERIRAQQLQVQQSRQQQQQFQQPQQQQQQPPQNYTQLKQSQQAAQMAQSQAAKRQKVGTPMNHLPQQKQYQQQNRTPQMASMQQPNSNVNTPIMGSAAMVASSPQMNNSMAQLPQSAQGQAPYQQPHPNTMSNRPSTQPALGQAGLAAAQKQQQRQSQQQIFQSALSPQEQHSFRQLQARMNTLLQMGNTGSAPNGTRLTPQQQQQALSQARNVQQQMLQRYPLYFQKLRQYQALQEQRLKAMQAQQSQSQPQQSQQQPQVQAQNHQHNVANQMNGADGSMYSQQNMGLSMTSPAMQQQMMSSPMMPHMTNGIPPGQGGQQ